jgi:peptide-N4-(N-acetyl-beta-glucosaminyl)asparagine amidase
MEFYRFNDVAKLLKTRAGRCGEWANCFTFLCRCLGYEARHVYSTSDHVWTEVYSATDKRWIHIDPSENVFDSPLMYEHGWKRNLSYVIAFSMDDVQDVTWRYTNQTDKVLKSRNFCTEQELLRVVMQLRAKRQAHCSDIRKMYLKRRTLSELVDFFRHRQPTEGELNGRSSGGLAWRLERGEEQLNNVSTVKFYSFIGYFD